MMKRVCKTRVGVCVMLLAVFLLVGGAGAPVFARQDISNGQAGDPGDGDEADSGGGTVIDGARGTESLTSNTDRPDIDVVQIPVFMSNNLAIQIVVYFVHYIVRQ